MRAENNLAHPAFACSAVELVWSPVFTRSLPRTIFSTGAHVIALPRPSHHLDAQVLSMIGLSVERPQAAREYHHQAFAASGESLHSRIENGRRKNAFQDTLR